jgi:hypothetical protein
MNSRALHDPSRRVALLIGAVAFVSYAYFYQGGGWNPNSRFDMVRAILERGTLSIDAYHENTQDKAISHGHYYSDKAPGQALLAVPAAAAARPLLNATGVDPTSPRGLVAMSYAAWIFSVVLPATLGCVCLFLIALRLGCKIPGAAFAALSMGLATPLWAYATLFFAHAVTGAFLLFAFAAALELRDSGISRSDLLWGLTVGLAAGWATVCEYPAIPASAIVAALALSQVWPQGWPKRRRAALGIVTGALACIAILAFYQRAAFGSAFHPSYSYYENGAFPWMKRGYMGLTYPRLDVMFKLLFGCKRGLFFAAPVAIAAPFGLRRLWKNPATRGAAAAAIAIFTYYLLFNSSFTVWTGAWSYGPRYMAAGVPALCVGLAPVWDDARPWGKKILAILALASVLFTMIAVSTNPHPSEDFRCPMAQLLWPSFWAGKLSLTHTSVLTLAEDPLQSHGAFNLGELAGLHGLPSLLPLLIVWALAGWVWTRTMRANDNKRPPKSSR